MAIEFKLSHTKPGQQMVEVWRDGVFVASIYPIDKGGASGLHIISKYMELDAALKDPRGIHEAFVFLGDKINEPT